MTQRSCRLPQHKAGSTAEGRSIESRQANLQNKIRRLRALPLIADPLKAESRLSAASTAVTTAPYLYGVVRDSIEIQKRVTSCSNSKNCRLVLKVNQASGSTYLLEADRATGSTYLWAYLSCAHFTAGCQSHPVNWRWINSYETSLLAYFLTFQEHFLETSNLAWKQVFDLFELQKMDFYFKL